MSNWEIKRRFRHFSKAHFCSAKAAISTLLLLFCVVLAKGQSPALRTAVVLTVVDENGLAVSGAAVTILEPGRAAVRLQTDYAGRCSFTLHQNAAYQTRVEKAGFYQSAQDNVDWSVNNVRVVLTHEQIVTEQVNVTASVPGIDIEQPSDTSVMNTPEIVNVPYPTSRDIRNLLPFNPEVVPDATGQVHVAGSPTYETLDTMDGFDIRAPLSGTLALRVSADAVRTTIAQSTRYPAEFGKASGGVVAFYTGMGDNKFRFNATDFIPSFRDLNGIRFDKFVPRFAFSGPLVRSRAWFYDGLETEWDNIYISELPANADTDELVRGSNLVKVQVNLTPKNILNAALLFNDYHSPYDGISSLNPQQSTTKRDTIAWLPYLRDKWSIGGALLDVGVGTTRIRDGYEPHGDTPYEITPELPEGSYFENLTGRSQRTEGTATLYLPPQHWAGRHDLRAGIDVDRISFSENVTRAPVSYLREDGTRSRESTFPQIAPFSLYNDELGAYAEDHWLTTAGLTIEPGLRLDWDEIIRRPLIAPRIAAVYAPPASHGAAKISAGVGLYYEHTQLEYLTRFLAGGRYDTYYRADGVTPISAPEETVFTADYASLHEARTVNWSVGVEQKLPGAILGGVNFLQKRQINGFIYENESAPALSGEYSLSNTRQDHYYSVEVNAKRTFTNGHTLFASYTHSSARTNAALDYMPDPSPLGAQQSGPQAWDAPNRVISWGWLPLMLPRLSKRWDFVYTVDWHTGFPYTSVDENQQVVGAAGSRRFPDYLSLSPGLEWRFHFRGAYFGLRGVMENATNSGDPLEVNNVVVSPQYGTVSEFLGRAFTARIRLIGAK
ncbi:MAG: carboxypeptidase regulatory-like domain-containing protein [Terracidiphilus sp.]